MKEVFNKSMRRKMTTIRLNKYLAECGVASRRKSEELIISGRVSVNNNIVIDLATVVDPKKDEVRLDGEKIQMESKVYFLLNKPKGFITTTSDEKNRPIVTDLINTNIKIFPVGRLDFNTTGLLLLTNDGDFANKLLHPRNKVKRVYHVNLDRPLTVEHKEKLLKGIYLERRKSRFTSVTFLKRNNYKLVEVETEEGRNHFVKNMFSTFEYNVKRLERVRFGSLNIEGLAPGAYKKLNSKQIDEMVNAK